MRSRLLTVLTNNEIEAYLEQNDLIFVPVGTVELHGALPVDCETVLAEALSLKMAEQVNGLVLPNLPYFYAGATAIGRGTVQVSVQAGIAYLMEVVKSLRRQGFGRIIFVSSHGPAHLTVSSVVRDFFDKTHMPVLYLDMSKIIRNVDAFDSTAELLSRTEQDRVRKTNSMFFAAYDILGRLEDIPLTTEPLLDCSGPCPGTTKKFNRFSQMAYNSGIWGFYFADKMDHAPTPRVDTAEERKKLAEEGKKELERYLDWIHVEELAELMKDIPRFLEEEVFSKYGAWLKFD